MEFCTRVKQVLRTKIREMAAYAWLFVRNPGRDFTRDRKRSFETTLQCLITMESGSLQKELLSLFQYDPHTPTTSALVQQRAKILPEALEFLFHDFNDAFPADKTYRGYRLLACDGADVNIAHNPSDVENYFQSKPGEKGFNQLHLNAMYDLCSRRYTDAIIQPGRYCNEYRAMADMLKCKALRKQDGLGGSVRRGDVVRAGGQGGRTNERGCYHNGQPLSLRQRLVVHLLVSIGISLRALNPAAWVLHRRID